MKRFLLFATLTLGIFCGSCNIDGDVAANRKKKAELKDTHEHRDQFEFANKLFEEKDYAKAEHAYQSLLKKELPASMEGKVLFNLGLILAIQGKYDDAVAFFQRLFDSEVDDKEEGDNLMELFRNYRHRACLMIASCYVSKKDYVNALKYAKLARDKYRYQTDCVNCGVSVEAQIENYVAALEEETKEK